MPKRAKDDCLRQCVARLTGREPRRVPHFVGKYKGRWSWHLARWCDRTGHAMFMLRPRTRVLFNNDRSGPWIAIGPTRKGKDQGQHAILTSNDGVIWNGGIPLRRVDYLLFIVKKRSDTMARSKMPNMKQMMARSDAHTLMEASVIQSTPARMRAAQAAARAMAAEKQKEAKAIQKVAKGSRRK